MGATTADVKNKNKLQQSITDQMMGIFDSVRKSKEKEYLKKGDTYIPANVDKLISKCGYINAGISGTAGLIPGPWGMLAAVPEITLIIKNQIDLIYDIGKSYGKENNELSTELLVGIFAAATGSAGIGLITVHGGKLLIKRASLRVLQKIIAMLGGKVTQKLLKSMVAKWLPGVGAAAMAIWSKYSTNMVGKKAIEYLSKEIIFDKEDVIENNIEFEVLTDNTDNFQESISKNKIFLLINLMKIDGDIAEEEVIYITSIIEGMDLSEDLTFELLNKINSPGKNKIDFNVLIENDEAMAILIDMVALAKADDNFHNFEKVYIKQVGRNLKFPEEDINDILNA